MEVNWRRSGPWFGAAGMVVALWFYGFVGLVAPWWVVPLMVALWLVLAYVGLKNFSRRPLFVMVLPFLALALWFAIVAAGGAWWGWQG